MSTIKTRLFTALQDGVVVRRGTFTSESLLRIDLPAPKYTLVLDKHLPFPSKDENYREMRALAYPSPAELGDALYWQAKGDNTKMEEYLTACEMVKLQYPKPQV